MSFFYKQLFLGLPSPDTSFAGKTVIVTGSNTGLGKEAARHVARLGASRLILAVRDVGKGDAAKKEIESSTGCNQDIVRVWPLDMASYESVQAFVKRAENELERVDILLANAGFATSKFETAEDNEAMVTVNVVATFLLVLAMLPKMKQTSSTFGVRPVVTITSSEAYSMTKFPEKDAAEGAIFDTLNDSLKAEMDERYPTSKLLEVLGVKHIGETYPDLPVTINNVNPGLCKSDLTRNLSGFEAEATWLFLSMFARTTEVGSRTLVHAISQGPETHGQYLSDCRTEALTGFPVSEEGSQVQQRVWKELVDKLEEIRPGVCGALN